MNRDIKFRCWQVEEFDEDDKPIKWEMIPADCLAFEEYEPLIDLLESNEHKILMQYTGLKDKNGKEIYEGDILCHNIGRHELKFVMKWDEDRSGWESYAPKEKFEIIGNIYENPELVNQKQQIY